MKKTLGIYYLATSIYSIGFKNFIKDLNLFLPEVDKTIIILSDELSSYDGKVIDGIKYKHCYINHYPWPIITLFKMYHIYTNRGNYDYVMYCDSTLIYNRNTKVNLDTWLNSERIILTRHAMSNLNDDSDGSSFNCYPIQNSSSYIDPETKFKYVQAGFFFGPSNLVYKMCYEIIEMIKHDMNSRIIPKWHDETYLNKWQVSNPELVDNSNKIISLYEEDKIVFVLRKMEKPKNQKTIKQLNIALTNGRFGNIMYPLMVGVTYSKKYDINSIDVFEIYKEHLPDILRKSLSSVFNFKSYPDPCPPLNIFYTCKNEELLPKYNEEVVTLGGYLQNSDLIDENYCREIFKCPIEIENQINNLYGDISTFIGLSIRRGNYVNSSIYQTLSVDFIDRMINKYYKGRTIICCSDDIEWCKENLSHIPNIIFQNCLDNKILLDWFILTKTSSNILSCSSFSMSAGLLNPNKHCIVPTPYFKPNSGVPWNDLLVPKFAIREPLVI